MWERSWRDGWVPFGLGGDGGRVLEPELTRREYRSHTAAQRDAILMAQDRWQVVSVVDRIPRGAIARLVSRWWCRLTGRPVPVIVVTYRRLR